MFLRSQEEIGLEAIKQALKALKKRHLLEEGAHAPAFIALSRPIISQVFLLLPFFFLLISYLLFTANHAFFWGVIFFLGFMIVFFFNETNNNDDEIAVN